jgi:hypothetical protein
MRRLVPLGVSLPRSLIALGVACAVFGVGVRDAVAATPRVVVTSPANGSLEVGVIKLRFRLPAGVRLVSASINDKDLTGGVRRVDGVDRVSVRAALLGPGSATAAVRAKTSSGQDLFGYAFFVVGRARPTLLAGRLRVTHGEGTVALHMSLRDRPTTMQVRLNGRRVRLLVLPAPGRAVVRLTTTNGLRFGRNRVSVLAFDAQTGRWARSSRSFKVTKGLVLASAGGDLQVTVGTSTPLSGSTELGASRQVGKSALVYRWRVVKRPHGLRPRLIGARTSHPRLVPRSPGVYLVRLEVSHRRRGARKRSGRPLAEDTVTVEAAAAGSPWGIPMTTLVPNADGSTRTTIQGVPINSDGTGDYVDTPANAMQVIVLDSATLGVDEVKQFTSFSDPIALAQFVKSITSDQIAIFTGKAGCCSPLASIGQVPTAGGFTIIFAGGNLDNPIAYNAGNTVGGGATPGGVSGVWRRSLTTDNPPEQLFTFAYPDAVPFDTMITDKSVTGGSGFNVQLASENYHVDTTTSGFGPMGIVVNALTADLATPPANVITDSDKGLEVYPLSGIATQDQGVLESLTNNLNSLAKAYPGLVLELQTWGSPKAETTAWGDVGDALTQYGGTSSVWDELNGTGNYALVGRAGAGATSALQASASSESSTPLALAYGLTATNNFGTLRGVLGRGQDSLPVVTGSTSIPTEVEPDPSGHDQLVNPMGMSVLAQAPPQPWPSSGPGFDEARAWISQKLGLGQPGDAGPAACYQPTTWDVRAEYCNDNLQSSWGSTYLTELNALQCPTDNSGFTAAQCQAVQAQLAKEFAMIAPVETMFANLQMPFSDASGKVVQDFVNASTDVDSSLSVTVPPANYNAATFVQDFFQPLQDLSLPEDLDDPGVSFALGVFASAIDMALGAVTDDDGNPALDQFDSTKAAIGTEALDRLETASDQLALVEEMILTDWTKLSTTAYYATNIWGTNATLTNEQASIVADDANAWLYKTMLPVAYSQIALNPAAGEGGLTINGVNNYSCEYGGYPYEYFRWPFQPGATPSFHGGPSGGTPLPADAAFAPLTATASDGTPSSPFIWALGDATGQDWFQTPSSQLMNDVFNSVRDGGAGLTKEQFYSWGWVSSNRYPISHFTGTSALDYAYNCS